ncbi:hypothetical protein BVRB_015160 isoform A [Beta vulgaris subsp. vulgaris]|uniref:Uncharacterized protein n=1 Tax=Beta vulgaris subsp. vulgaris TaxID=3555 RepID=A0A0J8B4N8_BETVV|nr:hypothetical protein BVRB_015160 isoform A [Beta vulgaris subsp. vulgaris]
MGDCCYSLHPLRLQLMKLDVCCKVLPKFVLSYYYCGGLQLAQGGNRIVFEEFLKKLEVGASIKELCIDLPIFSDINSKDPLKAFNN